MEIENTETTPTEEVVTPEVLTDGDEPTQTEDIPSPDYTPNLKYSVADQEKEFDDMFKEFVKSKEHEEKLRDLYTRADGLERVKMRRDELENKYQTLESQVGEVMRTVEKGDLKNAMSALGVDVSDFGAIAKGLGYTKEQILQHAYQLASLTPEQEQYQNQLTEAQMQQMQLQKEREHYQQELQMLKVQGRKTELQSVLTSQEVSGLTKTYDSALGTPGAFEQEVIRRGFLHHKLTGEDLPVHAAVEQVAAIARHMKQAQEPKAPRSQGEIKVIPNVGSGGSQAPVSKKISSIESLKAYASTLTD
jgi:hypothetical protein